MRLEADHSTFRSIKYYQIVLEALDKRSEI